MWDVRADIPGGRAAGIEQLKRGFEALNGRVPGLLHLEVGVDTSEVDYACDVVLYSEFESQEALEAYATHPEHLQLRHSLADLRTARHQVDYRPHPRQHKAKEPQSE